jgi:hypothetical protein
MLGTCFLDIFIMLQRRIRIPLALICLPCLSLTSNCGGSLFHFTGSGLSLPRWDVLVEQDVCVSPVEISRTDFLQPFLTRFWEHEEHLNEHRHTEHSKDLT